MLTSVPFRGFDEAGTVRSYYHGYLPHWRQTECTYFVTFRLADAVPVAVLKEFVHDRDIWLKARDICTKDANWKSELRKMSDLEQKIFHQFLGDRFDKYLDQGHGSCQLRDTEARKIVCDSLTFFQDERLWISDFVVMPNHVHAIVRPINGFELEVVLKSIKGYTSMRINERFGLKPPFWMKESYDRIVRNFDELVRMKQYIRGNPLAAGLDSLQFTLFELDSHPDDYPRNVDF
ncbi:transposase [Neorhodopirellula pilleata]|nr:transposase [Neorhodopirellula pilleata]